MRSLFEELGWRQMQQYQFAAFQAVVADQIGGDTLHHTCSISFGSSSKSIQAKIKQAQDLSKMRWLIIDEISQVGAELLSQCDTNIRSAVQSAGTYKHRDDGTPRPWGGLNVVYVGDFLQLPPTQATPLFTLPRSLLNIGGVLNPRVQHGLNLFWEDTNGIILFEQQMRCVDEWWLEVLNECRHGCMSYNTWAFLHGKPTSVSGKWLDGTVQCGTTAGPQCEKGCIQQHGECVECQEEHVQRCRVYKAGIHGSSDKRPAHKHFRHAVSVVPNNDLKMEIC